jgi:enoyl-CoA hydratase
MSREVVERLHEFVDSLNDSSNKLIFTGTGDAFASGANLNEIAALSANDAPEFARLGQALMNKIAELPQTTIAAINGFCFGGALDLALSCDVRIASPIAKFAHPGSSLGIITGWSGTQRLPRLIGTAFANEMFFTASPIDARRALTIGLIDEIADDPPERALQTLR